MKGCVFLEDLALCDECTRGSDTGVYPYCFKVFVIFIRGFCNEKGIFGKSFGSNFASSTTCGIPHAASMKVRSFTSHAVSTCSSRWMFNPILLRAYTYLSRSRLKLKSLAFFHPGPSISPEYFETIGSMYLTYR